MPFKGVHSCAYRTPVPHAITFEQYEALVTAKVQTPDLIPKIVSCKPMSSIIEYSYSVTNDQATITGFNKEYAGALSITNMLGGFPVTTIGNGAFSNCELLTDVIVPSSVTVIKDWAFPRCPALTNVVIPATVTQIGRTAFSDCNNLSPSVLSLVASKSPRPELRRRPLPAPLRTTLSNSRNSAPPLYLFFRKR